MIKKTTLIITGILLVVNILFGLLLSSYEWWNVLFSSIAIILTAAMIVIVFSAKYKRGYQVSLPFAFLFIGLIEFVLGVVSDHSLQDNKVVLAFIVLVAFQISLLIICNAVSKRVH